MDSTNSSAILDLAKYGITEGLFGASVSEELVVSVGLIAIVGALAEHKIENLWIELRGPSAAGKKGPSPNVTQNIRDCREILDSLDTGNEDTMPHHYEWHYRDKGLYLLEQAEKAFAARNDLVHRVWSVADAVEPSGYKTPPPKGRNAKDMAARPYRTVSKDEINAAIVSLVHTVEALDRFAGGAPGAR
ncbi:hypothetical protein [Arthrobacter sp. NPDC056727]|uniref:hypothetical protein n=1 Tax=Arthrobacter sp. NPDC056727 TaxID=3345927 RepID=UPI00366B2DB9